MIRLVLLGTAILVLMGTTGSCYEGPKSSISPAFSRRCELLNDSNKDSFGVLLTPPIVLAAVAIPFADHTALAGMSAGKQWVSAAGARR